MPGELLNQSRTSRRRFVVVLWRGLALRHRHKNKTDDLCHPFCFVIERRGRDWLLRSRWSLRLTPFPSARRRGPCKPTAQKAARRHLLFPHLCLQVNLRQRYKNKRYRFLDTFLLRGLAEREGFEPPEPRSSTVFKTAAIDHSATSPKDKSRAKK